MSEMDETDVPTDDPLSPPPAEETSGLESDLVQRNPYSGAASGIKRGDREGLEIVDAMAGRNSLLGLGCESIRDAIGSMAEEYLGDASAFVDDVSDEQVAEETAIEVAKTLASQFQQFAGDSLSVDSLFVCPSADHAVETAIRLARAYRPEKAYRTIAIVGGDHGRTGTCRSASGRPELHEDYGPMMSGFTHVPFGDLDAVRAVVDEQTACILLSPVQLRDAARSCDAEYLTGLREICDRQELLLIFDETQLTFGSSGRALAYTAIADVRADMVVLSGGLFGGLPGGVVLASQRVNGRAVTDTARYPLQTAVVAATLTSMTSQGLPDAKVEAMREFAVSLAEKLSGFEFVRDVNVLGMTIGIELDIESAEVVRVAAANGLRIEPAGTTSVCLQLPLVVSDDDLQMLLTRLGQTMEAIERQTADLSL